MSGFGYNVLGFGANAAGGGPSGPSDDQFNRTSFLSHFEGANNGVNNAFDDGSDSNHTITANGNVTQGSFGPFARPDGEWGAYFDGDGDYLSFPDSADWDFGTGDFTVEGWVNPASDLASDTQFIGFGDGDDGGNFGFEATGKPYFYHGGYFARTSTALNLGSWSHIAFVRSSGTLSCYINGTSAASSSYTGNVGGTLNPRIGAYSGGQYFKGYMSNVRIVKGTAVYTGNFTPSTSKLTAITNTKLLTCQSNRFVDNSASGHTITPTGNPAISAFGPFLTSAVYDAAVNGASAYFDGTGDYLDADDGVTFGTGAFTIEFFVYLNKSADQKLFDARPDGVNTVYPVISVLSDDTLNYYANSSNRITSSETLSENAWYHVAVCRSGTSTKMFLDGTQVGSTYSDSTNYADSGRMRIGASKNATSLIEGYMSDVRVVHSALYTSNFTPPTAPLTNITNTNLLLNMADGQAIDSAAQNNLALYDGANISTTHTKLGDSCVYLDGDDLVRTAINPSFAFGTGDFTIEGWVYLTAINQYDNIFDMRHSGSTTHIDVYFDGSPLRLRYFVNGGERFTSDTAVSLNTWTHLALVRSSGTTKLYQQGTSVGSYSDSTNLSSGQLHLGGRYSNENFAEGYFDEVRVSNMARYTSNFTPATEPFADKGQ